MQQFFSPCPSNKVDIWSSVLKSLCISDLNIFYLVKNIWGLHYFSQLSNKAVWLVRISVLALGNIH